MEYDLKKLGITVMVMLAVAGIVLIAQAVTNQYGYQLRTETDTTIGNLNLTALTTSVGTTGQYPYLQDLSGCYNSSNSSDTITSTGWTINEGDGNGGSVTLDASTYATWANETINCSTLTYLADSSGSDVSETFVSGLGIFAAFLSVVALAILGKAVVQIFSSKD